MTIDDRTIQEKIAPLRADIRMLGDLLGTIIREQQGDEIFELVETVRGLTKARRDGDNGASEKIHQLIRDTDLHKKRMIVKAFGNYLQLINIAEDMHRIRTLRRRERQRGVSESIPAAIRELHERGVSAATIRQQIEKIRVRLVLTAHPSEAKRQEVLIKLRDIADMLSAIEHRQLLPREEERLVDDVVRRIEQLWLTRTTRAVRATVDDEVEYGLYFLTNVIMNVVVEVYEALTNSLRKYYPDEDWSDIPPILTFGAWMGGDRDGNPNVTPEITLQTLDRMREAARGVYLADIAYIRDRLTQSDDEVPLSADLLQRWPEVERESGRYAGESYRVVMNAIHKKLAADEYLDGKSLLADLRIVADSLRNNKSKHSADGTLDWLMRKVAVFGLHLAPVDVREDARLHRAAIAEILERYQLTPDYDALSEEEKQALLTHEIASPRPLFPIAPNFSDETNRIIETWRMIATAHHRYGAHCIDCVIASMSKQASDVLTMLLFAREVGMLGQIDLVPLFETVDDLNHAPDVMTTLFSNPQYVRHLKQLKAPDGSLRQQIMIGYSDSNKDGGYIAANWSLYRAQKQLSDICIQQGVRLQFFHGRGGSIGRGGGPTNRAIRSEPPRSLHGEIKITEQGEVIAYRYGNAGIAYRHLNQVLHAVLMEMSLPHEPDMPPQWAQALDFLADSGRESYRALVYETPGFLEYWQQATPINELAQMPIGSRPAKRKKGGFEAIRAIPWVFSWMQSRAIIPSWYGVGWALEQYCQQNEDGLNTLHTMYQDWPFFKALIENVELDVLKADMGIAALYSELVTDEQLREQIFGAIRDEHRRAWHMISQVTGYGDVLERLPIIKRSIERRNPYVDPLNFVQVELLRELRTLAPGSPEADAILREVMTTISGIAAGMKTTG
ncbi:MAG: phosphoenolpyruvate carboxylase [Anaerolineaceae bacterium]|nr:MAG: phosphoenolpyruvate carboxylase [Anaerolineaceae bacterium]